MVRQNGGINRKVIPETISPSIGKLVIISVGEKFDVVREMEKV
jgi:hypothetical protein